MLHDPTSALGVSEAVAQLHDTKDDFDDHNRRDWSKVACMFFYSTIIFGFMGVMLWNLLLWPPFIIFVAGFSCALLVKLALDSNAAVLGLAKQHKENENEF